MEVVFDLSDSIWCMAIACVTVEVLCRMGWQTRSQLRFITLKRPLNEDLMVVLVIPLSDTGVLVVNVNCFVGLMLTRAGKLDKQGFVAVVGGKMWLSKSSVVTYKPSTRSSYLCG